MPQVDPNAVANRWAQNLGGAQTKMKAGAQAVTVSPTMQAAAAVQTWQQKMSLPQTAQRFVAGLQRVQLQDWQNAYINKGLPRIATGAQSAIPKFTSFLTQFLPFVENVAQQVRQMPKVTLEDSIARATAQIRGNAQFRRQ